jgi:thymidylate kinase
MIVSFSGIDGAGKTTQIAACEEWLRHSGFRTSLLTFWDDVVLFSRWREAASLRAFKGDCGVGSPQNPLHRRDKNVSSLPLTLARFSFYLADALHLRRITAQAAARGSQIVIFDRYIFDELANLPLQRFLPRLFAQMVLRIVPQPDLAFLIDAEPAAAHARKPEYPLDFVRRNREAYLYLARLADSITVVPPASVAEMKSTIRRALLHKLSQTERSLQSSTPLDPPANISSSELIES